MLAVSDLLRKKETTVLVKEVFTMSSLENAGQHVQATPSYPLIIRLLLWAGAVGPLLFVVVLLIEGATATVPGIPSAVC